MDEKTPLKRLYRSREDTVIAGVCGGLAEYLEVDPALVRLVALILFFAGGAGFLAYIAAWIIIPEKPRNAKNHKTDESGSDELRENAEKLVDGVKQAVTSRSEGGPRMFFGILFIGLGLLYLLREFIPWFSFGKLWPVLLILLGGVILLRQDR